MLLLAPFVWMLLTGCRQETAQERAYQLLTGTLEEGNIALQKRSRLEAKRMDYAVNIQGNRPEDVVYTSKVETFMQSTDSLVRYVDHLQGGVQSVMRSQPGDNSAVRTYLLGDGSEEDQGALYPLYLFLKNYRQPLSAVLGQDVGLISLVSTDSTTTIYRDFLQPFRGATATEALALLAAWKTRVLWLQGMAIEHAGSRVGALIIRDNHTVLVTNPARDRVTIGSQYEADLYLTPGLEYWNLYKLFINGKPADIHRPKVTLTAARGKDGKAQHWEARLYLYKEYGADTVLVVRRPYPLHERTFPAPAERP